jgi:hypothetical protein
MKYMMMPFRRIVFATLALVVVCGPAAIPQENRFAKGDSAYLERA